MTANEKGRRTLWAALAPLVLFLAAPPAVFAQCQVKFSSVGVPDSGYKDAPLQVSAAAYLSGCNFSGGIRYHWEFGDGASFDGPNAIHSYGNGRTYPWSVTASIDGSSDLVSGEIVIDSVCVCTLPCDVFGPFSGDVGEPIAFQIVPPAACCTTSFSYEWAFGDGSAHEYTASTTHEYAAPGFKRWVLNVSSGSNSCEVFNDLAIGPDVVADRIEVVQTVQDLQNSVRLVRDKPTMVRFHVHSARDEHVVSAALDVSTPTHSARVYPINPGGTVRVGPDPSRDALNEAFLFELPSEVINNSPVRFTARINPPALGPITSDMVLFERDAGLLDTRLSNDQIATTVDFEAVPDAFLILYGVDYEFLGRHYVPSVAQQRTLTSWLRRTYPIDSLAVKRRIYEHGDGVPTCNQVNAWLTAKRNADTVGIPPTTRYYGMVSDGGRFMRGCGEVGGHIASGPTGSTASRFRWDGDGEYGDWYGAHELAHTWNRRHVSVASCPAVLNPAPYPYANGRISDADTGDHAFYGFNTLTHILYGPEWTDLMTYCDYEWLSKFTYEGLMDRLLAEGGATLLPPARAAAVDRLMVIGSVDPATGIVDLQPLLILPNANELKERVPGPYSIVLRSANAAELARYAFTPSELDVDAFSDDGLTVPVHEVLMIDELVPYVTGTTRVDIEGPGGVLREIRAGLNPPSIHVISPNGGETLAQDKVQVSWSASDVDGDVLTFTLQYSRDGGATWETVAQNIRETMVDIDAINLPSATRALMRVIASDGIHSSSDQSDTTFTIPNHVPSIEIVEPPQDVTIAIGQTIRLVADAYDIDSGSMPDEQVDWYSDLDGYLGSGSEVAVTLSEGVHTVRFHADDGRGGEATDTVVVTVVGTFGELAPPPNQLEVDPASLLLDPAGGITSYTLRIANRNGAPIAWQASADIAWLRLSAVAGTTSAEITASLDAEGLAPGLHYGTISFTSSAAPGAGAKVGVRVRIPGQVLPCPGDCSGESEVTIEELVAGVNVAQGRFTMAACPAFDRNNDDQVDIDELGKAVQEALRGCAGTAPVQATPTPSLTVTSQRTRTPTPTPTASRSVTATRTPPSLFTITPTRTPTTGGSTHCDALGEPLSIPDGDAQGVASSLSVPLGEATVISCLRVQVDIEHSWVGDLSVTLLHEPTLTSILLLWRPGVTEENVIGCAGDNVSCVFDDAAASPAQEQCADPPPALSGVLRPLGALSNFAGESSDGTWTILVADNEYGDVGALHHWCLTIE